TLVQPSRSTEVIVALCGCTLIVAAIAAHQSWLDRHFLPSFFIPRRWYVLIETTVRVAIAFAGVSLVIARSRVARLVTRAPGLALRIAVAGLLAVACAELALRWMHLQPTEWLLREEEPRRQEAPQLGWVLAPGRTGRASVGGRTLEYAVDAAGYRVRGADDVVDPGRPTLVFAGESVMFGEGLAWNESIPAQVTTMVGVQNANLAVHGYSTDQIY